MRRSLLIVLLLVVLGACSNRGGEADAPDYEPLSVAELSKRIAALPGVVDVAIRFRESDACLGGCPAYLGHVEAAADVADPVALLDAVYAILRMGEPEASLRETRLDVRPRRDDPPGTDRVVRGDDVAHLMLETDRRDRYGPQPGTGKPPAGATYANPRAGLD